MKKRTHHPDQMGFEACVEKAANALVGMDRHCLVKDPGNFAFSEFGRWIRNNCGLWAYGTDLCVADIVREYKAGRLKSENLDRNRFVHPELPFDLDNVSMDPGIVGVTLKNGKTKKTRSRIDNTLAHPDNCSAVIIEAVVERVRNESGQRG